MVRCLDQATTHKDGTGLIKVIKETQSYNISTKTIAHFYKKHSLDVISNTIKVF